jgi:hypothetical protein
MSWAFLFGGMFRCGHFWQREKRVENMGWVALIFKVITAAGTALPAEGIQFSGLSLEIGFTLLR